MIKKILLAYDGSAGAKDAAEYAAELAQRYEAEVTVITVGGPLLGAAMADVNIPHMDKESYERVADEALSVLAGKHVRTQRQFRWLDPADQIIQEAREGNYDLIVMGHRSVRSSIRRDSGLLGSVAIKVINYAPCSVLVVRPSANNYITGDDADSQGSS